MSISLAGINKFTSPDFVENSTLEYYFEGQNIRLLMSNVKNLSSILDYKAVFFFFLKVYPVSKSHLLKKPLNLHF